MAQKKVPKLVLPKQNVLKYNKACIFVTITTFLTNIKHLQYFSFRNYFIQYMGFQSIEFHLFNIFTSNWFINIFFIERQINTHVLGVSGTPLKNVTRLIPVDHDPTHFRVPHMWQTHDLDIATCSPRGSNPCSQGYHPRTPRMLSYHRARHVLIRFIDINLLKFSLL